MRDLAFMREQQCPWLLIALNSKKDNVGVIRHLQFVLKECYGEFDGIIKNYNVKPCASRIDLTAVVLKDFYEGAPTYLKEKLDVRRKHHDLDECPYCGNPFGPTTLDHFLPKDDWPEYSIFSNNLVPQCSDCMPIKGRRYYSPKHGQALFMHPMYSAALSSVMFQIDVTLVNQGLVFDVAFSIANKVSNVDEQRLKLHLSSLNVRERIAAYCEKQYRHWIRQARLHGADIQAAFKARVAENELDMFGSNWKIAFYKGMLRNPKAVAHLQSFAGTPVPSVKLDVRPLIF